MPDNTFPDANKNNDEVARKLAEQDQAGRSTVADQKGIADASDALDALLKKAEADAKAKEGTQTPPAQTPPAQTPPADDAAAKAAAEAAAKAAAEKKAADDARAADLAKADDIFKDVPALPQNASPKSVESFATVKIKAAQEISKLNAELEKARTQVAEFEKRSKQPAPELEAKEKELTDLRAKLAKLDVTMDPKFTEFDKKAGDARELVYSLLKESPVVNQAIIDEIKKFGGPEKTNLSKLFEAMKDPALQKMVETKILDIKTANIEKERAVKATQDNVTEWMKERSKASSLEKEQRTASTRTELNGMLESLDWFKDQKPGDKATDAEKATIEASNKLVNSVRGELLAALEDDSPRMKAILLTGIAQLTRLQNVHEALKTEHEATKKQLTDAQALIEKIKQSSTSRLRESAAPVDGKLPQQKANIFTTPTTDALDTLAKQVTEAKRAAGQ